MYNTFTYLTSVNTFKSIFNKCHLFQNLNDWSFNVYKLNTHGNGQPIKYLGYDLLNRYGIFQKFKVSLLNTLSFIYLFTVI